MKTKKEKTKYTIRFVIGWILIFFFWWVLGEGTLSPMALTFGLLGSAAVVILYRRFGLSIDIPMKSLTLPLIWMKYIFSLLLEIGKTTIETCYLILTGKFKQEIIAYETELETGCGLLFLLNSITLTPITIAVLSEDKLVYIHHLRIEDKEDYREKIENIRSSFENPLKELIG